MLKVEPQMERIEILSLYSSANHFLHSSQSSAPSSLNFSHTHLGLWSPSNFVGGSKPWSSSCRFVVLSTHSNPKILKSNRRSRYGEALSPYEFDDDEDEYEDEDGVGETSGDDWLLNVSFSGLVKLYMFTGEVIPFICKHKVVFFFFGFFFSLFGTGAKTQCLWFVLGAMSIYGSRIGFFPF